MPEKLIGTIIGNYEKYVRIYNFGSLHDKNRRQNSI